MLLELSCLLHRVGWKPLSTSSGRGGSQDHGQWATACQPFPKTAPAAGKERVGGKPLLGHEQVEALGRQGRDYRASPLSLGHRIGDSEPALSPESVCLVHQAPAASPRKFSCRLTPSQVRGPEAAHFVDGETEAQSVPGACPEGVAPKSSLLPAGRLGWKSAKEAAGHVPEPSAHLGDWPEPYLLIRG